MDGRIYPRRPALRHNDSKGTSANLIGTNRDRRTLPYIARDGILLSKTIFNVTSTRVFQPSLISRTFMGRKPAIALPFQRQRAFNRNFRSGISQRKTILNQTCKSMFTIAPSQLYAFPNGYDSISVPSRTSRMFSPQEISCPATYRNSRFQTHSAPFMFQHILPLHGLKPTYRIPSRVAFIPFVVPKAFPLARASVRGYVSISKIRSV